MWACLDEPDLPLACGGNRTVGSGAGSGSGSGSSTGTAGGGDGGGSGGAGRDLACFVFDERVGRFAYWGRNSDLRLVPPPPPAR